MDVIDNWTECVDKLPQETTQSIINSEAGHKVEGKIRANLAVEQCYRTLCTYPGGILQYSEYRYYVLVLQLVHIVLQ